MVRRGRSISHLALFSILIPIVLATAASRVHAQGSCLTGVLDPATFNSNNIVGTLYLRVRLSDCASCGTTAILPSRAYVRARFDEPCAVRISATILRVDQSQSCPVPDTRAVLCSFPAQTYAGVLFDQDIIYNFPTSSACCLDQDFFLMLTLSLPNPCSRPPRIQDRAICDGCLTWWQPFSTIDPACDGTTAGWFVGDPLVRLNSFCCGATPATPGSWGQMKLIYR